MQPINKEKLVKKLGRSTERFNTKEQVLFFQELGELLKSGYSINQSLDILALAHQNWQTKLQEMNLKLVNGQTLPDVLAKVVKSNILLQLRLAHQHGDLIDTLIVMGDNLEQFQAQQNKIRQILRYPAILLLILGAMAVGLRLFLYPLLAQWQTTPTSHVDNHIRISIYIILMVSVIAIVAFYWHKLDRIQRLLYLTRLPVIGRMTQTIVTCQVAQQLALLMKSGLSLPEIIDAMASEKTLDDGVLLAQQAKKKLDKGLAVERYILETSYLNSALAGYFVRGHEPKTLAHYLDYFAKTQFKKFIQQTDRLIGLLQPLFFAIVGIAIVGMYISMLLPMYKTIGELY